MDVSIIFVNYKTKDLTIKAIKSVQEKTEDIEYEIFVVDNNSQDGSIEAIEKEFPNINIIKNTINAGFGAASNLGIKQAKGKYILCLNTDTLLINNAIKIMFDFMEKEENKNVGVCGGYLVDENMKPAHSAGHFPCIKEIIFKFGLRDMFPKIYKNFSIALMADDTEFLGNIDLIIGADIFFRKSILDEVGIFDENYFMYFEETDLCKRIKDAGYQVKFVEEARIQHLEQKSSPNELLRKQRCKDSEFYYYRKHSSNKVWIAKILYAILFTLDWIIHKNQVSRDILLYIFREV